MARSSLYVVIAVVCAAVAGCAATRGFADERLKLGQRVRGDESSRYSIHFNYTTENKDSYVGVTCHVDALLKGQFKVQGDIYPGGSWSFESGVYLSLYCSLNRIDIDFEQWDIKTWFWKTTEEQPWPTGDKSYLIDDVGVYNFAQGEKKLIIEWNKDLGVLASAVQSA